MPLPCEADQVTLVKEVVLATVSVKFSGKNKSWKFTSHYRRIVLSRAAGAEKVAIEHAWVAKGAVEEQKGIGVWNEPFSHRRLSILNTRKERVGLDHTSRACRSC